MMRMRSQISTTRVWRLARGLTAGFLALAGCSDLSDLPQQELTFAAGTTAQDLLAAGHSGPALEYAAEQEGLYLATALRVMGRPANAAMVGFGFVGASGQSYSVYADGSARLFRSNGEEVMLDAFDLRLDGAFLAGPGETRIIGRAAGGTLTSWNAANLSQQLLLRPQKTTFGQTRVLDAEPVAGSPSLAMVTEDRGLELWSLISGNRTRSGRMPEGVDPRVLMPGSREGAVVFGTQNGEVRIWSGGNGSRLLYAHDGPVLALLSLGNGRIASAGKDGVVRAWSVAGGRDIGKMRFDHAVYDLTFTAESDTLAATPSLGRIQVLDIQSGSSVPLIALGEQRFSRGRFTDQGRGFIARDFGGRLHYWSFKVPRRAPVMLDSRRMAELGTSGRFSDFVAFSVLPDENLLLAATGSSVSLFDMRATPHRFIGTLLRSDVEISGLRLSSDEGSVLLALADGRLVGFRLRPDLSGTIDLGVAAQ